MSKNPTQNEENSVLDKLGQAGMDLIGQIPPGASRILSGKLNQFLDSINVAVTAERLTEQNPGIPEYRVRIAALVGTFSAAATSTTLDTAITLATTSFIVSTGGSGTPVAFALWGSGQIVVADTAEYTNEAVSDLVINLLNFEAWDEFLLDVNNDPRKALYHRNAGNGAVSTLGITKHSDNTEISYVPGTDLEVTPQEAAHGALTMIQSGKPYGTFFETPNILISLPNQQCYALADGSKAIVLGNAQKAISWGDPHLITSDGLKYDFQQRGEYVLLDSPRDWYQLQVRQEKWDKNPKVSVNTALATELNGTKVMIKPVGNVQGNAPTPTPTPIPTPTPTPSSSSTTGVFDTPVPTPTPTPTPSSSVTTGAFDTPVLTPTPTPTPTPVPTPTPTNSGAYNFSGFDVQMGTPNNDYFSTPAGLFTLYQGLGDQGSATLSPVTGDIVKIHARDVNFAAHSFGYSQYLQFPTTKLGGTENSFTF